MNSRTNLLILLLVIWMPAAMAKQTAKHEVQDQGTNMNVSMMLPTVLSVSHRHVDLEVARLRAMRGPDLVQFLTERPVDVVLGPGGRVYVLPASVPFALAAMKAGVDVLPVTKVADWSGLTPMAFWEIMRRRQWVETHRLGEGTLSEGHLPQGLTGVSDDPFLGVAWEVAQRGGFRLRQFGRAVFVWADYLRTRVPVPGVDEKTFAEAVEQGLSFAKSPATRLFPGAIDRARGCASGLTPQLGTVP